MKVIDLLNKIANNEELPKKIKDGAFELTLDRDGKHYSGQTTTVLNDVFGMNSLNDEIEIIENKPKKIEKIPVTYQYGYSQESINEYLRFSINEIIDKVNLLEKSDKE